MRLALLIAKDIEWGSYVNMIVEEVTEREL
jgi:hypothetical protein